MVDTDTELGRAERFSQSLQERISERIVEWRGGIAYLHSGLPKVWDLNLLRLEEPGLDPEEIALEADRVLGDSGCEHRRVWVPDPDEGAALEKAFIELGWEADVHVIMAHRREPDLIVNTSLVFDAGDETWPAREEQLRGYAWADDDEVIAQMKEFHDRLLEVGNGRDYGIVEDDRVVSFALLFSDGTTGQIEDVATLEEYRNRGLSRQVVTKALEVSRAEHDFTFLIADARDWPQEFYSKLGFDEVGHHYYFLKTPARNP